MEVSSQTNNYQMMNQYQNKVEPTPLPVVTPPNNNEDIYEASNGNLIQNKENEVVLTPQGQLNVSNSQSAKAEEADAAAQAEKDAKREMGADYIAHQSKKSQVEIYLSVATDDKVSLGDNDTASIIETLRDVQKQNNAVEAYATYQENQKGGHPALF